MLMIKCLLQKPTWLSITETTQIRSNSWKKQWKVKKPDKKDRDKKIGPRLEADVKSLASKGFLRAQKAYDPPENVESRIKEIAEKILGAKVSDSTKIADQKQRYALFMECNLEFDHALPNSLLHTITNLRDLIEFYTTPICTQTPFDTLLSKQLPDNLHVQPDYVRFTNETAAAFDNLTAFPKSSTIVTGLKYRKKYQGYQQLSPWTDL